MLRDYQLDAINACYNETKTNFRSGVIFSATGTGKSHIMLELLLEYNKLFPKNHILWICEQKSILIDQFDQTTIKQKGYNQIHKTFFIMDFAQKKPGDWPSLVSSATIWKRPLLIVINRAFLTSGHKYTSLKTDIGLVLHDECHSIQNNTTQEFYKYILDKQQNIKPVCIGFSATPNLSLEPFSQILFEYTIYNAYLDDVIVPPKIKWIKKDNRVTNNDIIQVLYNELPQLPYRKVIVWCGMIHLCIEKATEWKQYFNEWLIAIDTSQDDNTPGFSSYKEFRDAPCNAILFCAGKHREGSDIPYLDCCIFLDGVEDRCSKTFIQCLGRVLRKDPEGKKRYGLTIDICAASAMSICDKMNNYINPNGSGHFPFQYSYETLGEDLILNTLDFVKPKVDSQVQENTLQQYYNLKEFFIRDFPNDPRYLKRVIEELDMLTNKGLTHYLYRAVEILKLTDHIPHVTRGSCGSSLVCYLLGISNVDPIRYNIKFARFLNEFRDTLPDIDYDFPYNVRDEVFLQIQIRWPNKVARISNHVYYHEKSAIREAIRQEGIHKMIPAIEIDNTIKSLDKETQKNIRAKAKELEDTFKCYSLHCGGICFFEDGIPNELKLKIPNYNPVMPQLVYNKDDISKAKQFKIDILSSKALAQLSECVKLASNNKDSIDFYANLDCPKTVELFQKADNIGIILAESPLMNKALLRLKPKDLHGIAICLSIIRPAARDAKACEKIDDLANYLVFDDDAIDFISKSLGCSEAEADKWRRALSKKDNRLVAETKYKISKQYGAIGKELLTKLAYLRDYGFCKAHAYSYAQLVWQLAYQKANNPIAFWKASLKHCNSIYRKWVHLYEARLAGVTLDEETHPSMSIYANARKKKNILNSTTPAELLRKTGQWNYENLDFYPDCGLSLIPNKGIRIRGLIACYRVIDWSEGKKTIAFYIGYKPKGYCHITITSKRFYNLDGAIGITATVKKVPNENKAYICLDNAYTTW